MLNKKQKKAQAWGFDLMIALVIFSMGIIVFFIYSINYSKGSTETFESMISDGNFIADNLLSQGIPDNWDSLSVQSIGILNSGKVNNTKLKRFYDLSVQDYGRTKRLFNTQYNYFFAFNENITLEESSFSGIGKLESNSSNLIRINRFAIYNDHLVNAYIYIWN